MVCGKPVLFTDEHIRQNTVPEDMFVYELRHDQEGEPKSVEMRVNIFFYGAILMSEPLDVDYDRHIDLKPGDVHFMDGELTTLEKYRAAFPPGMRESYV